MQLGRTWQEWMHTWGATDDEIDAALPGDELLPDAANLSTRAVTVHAPASRVWPWLQQIDQQRGGFYSFRVLENLVGCRMPRVHRLRRDWRDRAVGETVWMAPPEAHDGQARMVVARVEPGHALVLESPDLWDGKGASSAVSGTWSLVVEPVDDHTSRLIARSRYARPLVAFDVAHFVMERKMLRTIAALAEATPAARPADLVTFSAPSGSEV